MLRYDLYGSQREGESGPEKEGILFPGQEVALPSELFSFLFFFPPDLIGMWGREAHVPECTCRGQRATFGNQFSPPTTRDPGIEHRSSGLRASSFSHLTGSSL